MAFRVADSCFSQLDRRCRRTAYSLVAILPEDQIEIHGETKACKHLSTILTFFRGGIARPSYSLTLVYCLSISPSLPLPLCARLGLVVKDTTPDSGNTSYRRFCGECGAPVQTVSPSRAGSAIIKMGLFAKSGGWGSQIDTPVAQIYTRNKKDWEPLIDGVAAVDGMPPPQ